jgi:hypothetical protein
MREQDVTIFQAKHQERKLFFAPLRELFLMFV